MTTVFEPERAGTSTGANPSSSDLGEDGSPALHGDLARFVGVDVLQFLKLAGATGIVEFERRGERLAVAFAHGRPVQAQTTGRSVRLGEALVHRGAVRGATVRQALARQRERPDARLGDLLREHGVADAEVTAAAAEVFRRLVCLLALWRDGTFRFVPGPAPAGDDAALDLELDRVMLEGLHAADPYSDPA